MDEASSDPTKMTTETTTTDRLSLLQVPNPPDDSQEQAAATIGQEYRHHGDQKQGSTTPPGSVQNHEPPITIDYIKELIEDITRKAKASVSGCSWDRIWDETNSPDQVARSKEKLVAAFVKLTVDDFGKHMNTVNAQPYAAPFCYRGEYRGPAPPHSSIRPNTPNEIHGAVTIDHVKRLMEEAVHQVGTLPSRPDSILGNAFGPGLEVIKDRCIAKLGDVAEAVKSLYEDAITLEASGKALSQRALDLNQPLVPIVTDMTGNGASQGATIHSPASSSYGPTPPSSPDEEHRPLITRAETNPLLVGGMSKQGLAPPSTDEDRGDYGLPSADAQTVLEKYAYLHSSCQEEAGGTDAQADHAGSVSKGITTPSNPCEQCSSPAEGSEGPLAAQPSMEAGKNQNPASTDATTPAAERASITSHSAVQIQSPPPASRTRSST